jgi:peptidoglycan/LPS O-acetylase OafA/YrhL
MHQPANSARLYFLDWVRIIAFFVLIVYHVGMYYVSWDWHVKSPAASTGPEPFMMLSSPWRLGLLFLVSGVASSVMLARTRASTFLRRRSVRLLLPLVFGMLVVVPPQAYLEVVEKLGYSGGYAEFMRLYVTGYHGFCRGTGCLDLPTWNHLWFVAYLWVYTVALASLVAVLGPRFDVLARWVAGALRGWRIIVVPAAVLAVLRLLLVSRYPSTHALVGDWFNHATYFFLFALGALLARAPAFWPRIDALRWPALAIAAAGWAALVVGYLVPDGSLPKAEEANWIIVLRTVYALFAWCAIVAACAFAQRHLGQDGPARRYLTEAVFPVYIAHQTLIVVVAHALKPLHIAPGLEAVLLVVVTISASFGLFEVVRRVPLLRPVFGLAAQPGPHAAAGVAADVARVR